MKASNILILTSFVICLIGIYLNIPNLIYIPLAATLTVLIFKLQYLFQFDDIKKEFQGGSIAFLKNCIEIMAFLFAGLYFLYQVVGNVDITNLNIEVDTNRKQANSIEDYLSINVKLNKGAIASVHLHEIKAYLYSNNSIKPSDSINFNGLTKVKIITNKKNNTHTTYNKTDSTEKYRLAANESTQFATFKKIPKGEVIRIEVIVITERRKLLHSVSSQFKASVMSLPNDKTD